MLVALDVLVARDGVLVVGDKVLVALDGVRVVGDEVLLARGVILVTGVSVLVARDPLLVTRDDGPVLVSVDGLTVAVTVAVIDKVEEF